ncbi:type IV pilus assembly protein FimV [Candidatus Puniceispirillum sp.]|uniref:type IV pilus assembly protein FimV n=1 Tax=Candidatus Puniceispirillum sp. TaxID=2026719 RepID=UPI003F69CD09
MITRIILTITLLMGLTVSTGAFSQSQPLVVLEYPNQSASGNVDSNNPFVIDPNYATKHKVAQNETLSHVINKHYANSGLNLKFIEMAIVAANAKAFVRGNPNFLYADKTLHLPSLNEIQDMILGKNKSNAASGGGGSQSDQIYFIGG